jgi:hypothetical protein
MTDEEVTLLRYRVTVVFEVDAENAEEARGAVESICEFATEDADDPSVGFVRVLEVIRDEANDPKPQENDDDT